MQRFNKAVASGDPVNPPIWWIAPEDKIAQRIDDEFLLGEDILVAPVVVQGEIIKWRNLTKLNYLTASPEFRGNSDFASFLNFVLDFII